MAADIDPESEALIRQLHRELNGLTRTSRRGNPFDAVPKQQLQPPQPREKETRSEGAAPAGGPAKRPRPDKERGRSAGVAGGSGSHRSRRSPHNSRQRQRRVQGVDDSEEQDEGAEYGSRTPSSSDSDSPSRSETQAPKRHKGGASPPVAGRTKERVWSKDDDREGSRGEHDALAKQQLRQKDRLEEAERELEQQRDQRTAAGPAGVSGQPPHRGAASARPEQGQARKAEGQTLQQATKDADRTRGQGEVNGLAAGAGAQAGRGGPGMAVGPASTEPEPHRPPPGQQQQQQADEPQAPVTPLEAAAAAASCAVKEQVRSSGQVPDPRMVKCFHAGVRWGIKLPRQALQTRSDLATALNDAFAGEILSCGRGETLSIVFLDVQGKPTEFPSLRGPNGRGKDSATKWRAMVERAVKIYVRRS
ncbi:hypothetical protein TSOC_006012 [Tetrabaena socialis]|uniref:Uncharacterized protein n=1 Tax=Tetrabaena socialis TaxID=47790 RepID=A0A2J8A4T7_9CHLO|nr:hypothetical protein TSOC_006012 [Tetrabaena socialis]|eukprot:PNH07527.1 hypothetical protein TSOC_006012 [Tetrabaena socialis]